MSAVESRDWIGHRKERTVRERRELTEVEKKSRTKGAPHRDINPARHFTFQVSRNKSLAAKALLGALMY